FRQVRVGCGCDISCPPRGPPQWRPLAEELMARRRPVWAQIAPMPKAALVAAARAYEAAGVEGVWAPQLFGAPFSTLSAVGAVTDRLKLGTGIALAFVRSPLETACSDAMVESIAIIGNA